MDPTFQVFIRSHLPCSTPSLLIFHALVYLYWLKIDKKASKTAGDIIFLLTGARQLWHLSTRGVHLLPHLWGDCTGWVQNSTWQGEQARMEDHRLQGIICLMAHSLYLTGLYLTDRLPSCSLSQDYWIISVNSIIFLTFIFRDRSLIMAGGSAN